MNTYNALVVFALVSGLAANLKADALNENRILRKAGGESKGKINLRITKTPYSMGVPDVSTVSNETRTGDVKIPTKEGKAKSLVDHASQPGPLNDTTARGRVSKADVSRSGKVIKYAGKGTAEPVFDDDGDFKGTVKGTSKIRGSKVITKGAFRGKRILRDQMTLQILEVTNVAGDGSGMGNF